MFDPTNVFRIAIYLRISTNDGSQETENQRRQLRQYCHSQKLEIFAEYEDHDSGCKADRVAFQRLLRDAAQRKFDMLLFWSLDRFSREGALATLQHLNALSGYGVGYRSYSEPYLDSCGVFRDAIIAILGTIAKQESIRISERVRAGLARAKEHGTRSGKEIGRPRVVFRRDEARRLREEGASWRTIARRLGVSIASIRRACQT